MNWRKSFSVSAFWLIYPDADSSLRVHFDPYHRFVFSKPAPREYEADSPLLQAFRQKGSIVDLFNPKTFQTVFHSEGKRANGRVFIHRALNIISPNICQVFSKIFQKFLCRIHVRKRGNKSACQGRMFFKVSLEGFLLPPRSLLSSG